MTDMPLIIDAPDATGSARVRTTALLPSGAVLSLAKRFQGAGRYTLSDDGAGAEDARALGHAALTGADTKRGRAIADQFGLEFHSGVFEVRDVTDEQLFAVTVYLAEATRLWSSDVAEAAARRGRADLVDLVEDRVRQALGDVSMDRDRELTGASKRRYTFDLVAKPRADSLILFETVTPFAVSLSAAHLKLFDLKEARPDWPREVVTERLDAWDQADLVLLSGVASHVRDFSRPQWNDLRDLAA